MSWPSNYGRLWGQIPNTAGQVFWVSPSDSYTVNGISYPASDNHDGLAPDRALRTIDRAWNLVTANAGDIIVLLPGTHSPSSSIAADVAGVTMMGLPSGNGNRLRQKAIIEGVTGDETINVTAANIEVGHLTIIPATENTALAYTADADQMNIHDCAFDLATPATDTSTRGIEGSAAASNTLIERCYFECDGAQGQGLAIISLDGLVSDCVFMQSSGTWAAALAIGGGTDRTAIERCRFYCSGTAMTVGIDGTGADQASGVMITDCRFGSLVTNPVDNFSAGEAELSENYHMGVGACDGGALITAIT